MLPEISWSKFSVQRANSEVREAACKSVQNLELNKFLHNQLEFLCTLLYIVIQFKLVLLTINWGWAIPEVLVMIQYQIQA